MKWYSYSKGAPETPAINVGRSRPVDRYVAIVAVRSLQWIVAAVYLRWFILEGLPKELLNKRRQNRDK
jgi:hypothetical protein